MYFEVSERKNNYICANYPNIFSLRKCIMKFRELFKKKNLALFYIFIEKYINIDISSLLSFANGLLRILKQLKILFVMI